jgi:hypothetical protein
MRDIAPANLDAGQAAELAALVEVEARWENLRKTPSWAPEATPSVQDLHDKQKAYEAFRTRLAAYNKRYAPPHMAEVLLNTPARLGFWSRRMRDLYLRFEDNPAAQVPVHLVEKAYRWADRVADRMGKDRLARPAPPPTVQDATRQLDSLAQWCDLLAGIVSPVTPDTARPLAG